MSQLTMKPAASVRACTGAEYRSLSGTSMPLAISLQDSEKRVPLMDGRRAT
ncbi:hypothetical protein GCM10018779_57500 [Streptomyces griseocarneus]|nr:hypothetical protein GCM10018779_57500 [Streptomyces griseocarneus]